MITGAGQGIGSTLALAYAERGATLIILEKKKETGEKVQEEITARGGSAVFLETDIGNPASVLECFQKVKADFQRLDILVNNAAMGIWKSPLELTIEEWDQVLNINLRGAFLCAREAAKIMIQGSSGSIVNIASTRAIMSEENSEAYAASKGGLVSLTHALAASLSAHKIRVNCISPGWIATEDYEALRPADHLQHPAGRVGMPEDIVRACMYLTDPDNDFVSGINLVVDGGMTRKMIYVP